MAMATTFATRRKMFHASLIFRALLTLAFALSLLTGIRDILNRNVKSSVENYYPAVKDPNHLYKKVSLLGKFSKDVTRGYNQVMHNWTNKENLTATETSESRSHEASSNDQEKGIFLCPLVSPILGKSHPLKL